MLNFKYDIVKISEKYREKVNNILREEWESTNIMIRGQIIDGTKLDGFLAIIYVTKYVKA